MTSPTKSTPVPSSFLGLASRAHRPLTLVWSLLSTYAVWKILFAWNGRFLLAGPDTAFHHYPVLKEILSQENLLTFHFGQGGGTVLYPAVGLIPLERLLIGSGLGIQTSINLTLIFMQALSAYFCLAFIRTWRRLYWTDYLLTTLLVSFSPSMMTRFQAGHVNFILSCFSVPALLFILSAVRKRFLPGPFDFALLCFGLAQAVSSVGYQTVYYGILLMIPLGIWAARPALSDRPGRIGTAWLISGLLVTTLTFCWAEVMSIFRFYSSSELSRRPGDTQAVFQYFQPDFTTWMASLFQARSTIPASIPTQLHHEIAFPALSWVGVMSVLYSKTAFRRWILWLVAPMALFFFIFSLNPPYFSDAALKIIPGLGAFRVPTRFMIPLLTAAACFILLIYRSKEKVSPREFILLSAGIVAGCAVSLLGQVASVSIEILVLVLLLMGLKVKPLLHTAIGMLVGSSLFGAMERKAEFIPYNFDPKAQTEIINRSKSILERSEYLIPGSPTNAGMISGAYSLSFYLNPQRTFTDLLGSFTGTDEAYRMSADFSSPRSPSFFKALFNSTDEIRKVGVSLRSERVRESHPVRIPTRTARMTPKQVAELSMNREQGYDYILNVLDSPRAPESIPSHCRTLKYRIVTDTLSEISIELEGPTKGCFMVLPINFSSLIEATGSDGSRMPINLNTLLSHQTLLGIELAEGLNRVSIRPKVLIKRHHLILQLLAGLVLIGAWALYLRKQERQIQKSDQQL